MWRRANWSVEDKAIDSGHVNVRLYDGVERSVIRVEYLAKLVVFGYKLG